MTRAFTLVETVITIAISVMGLVALTNLFLLFNSLYSYQQAFIATAGSTSASFEAIEAAVLPASKVLASRSFSGTTYASSATALVLELPAVDSAGAPIESAKDYVAFYADGATLYRLVEAAAGSARHSGRTILSSTLAALSFTYNDADATKATRIAADIQTEATLKGETVASRLAGQWYLRNRLTP